MKHFVNPPLLFLRSNLHKILSTLFTNNLLLGNGTVELYLFPEQHQMIRKVYQRGTSLQLHAGPRLPTNGFLSMHGMAGILEIFSITGSLQSNHRFSMIRALFFAPYVLGA